MECGDRTAAGAKHYVGGCLRWKRWHSPHFYGGPQRGASIELGAGSIFERKRSKCAASRGSLRYDRRIRSRRTLQLPLASDSVQIQTWQFVDLPVLLHMVTFHRRRGAGQFLGWG